MDAKTSKSERRRIIESFQNGVLRCLSVVNILNEGVDLPCANTCWLVDNTGSKTVTMQRIGRVLRLHQGKKMGHIVVGSNDEKYVRKVLSHVSSYDSRFKNGSVSRMIINLDDGARSVGRIFGGDVNDAKWMQKYLALKAHLDAGNPFPVRSDKTFGMWIQTQRSAKKGKGTYKMTPERIELLEALPGWFWEKDYDDQWIQKYEALQEHLESGNLFPASSDKTFGQWINTQRSAKKGQGTHKMTPERIELLEALPGWFWEKDLDDQWLQKYEALRDHLDSGNPFPAKSDKTFGRWINNLRSAKKGRGSCKMTPEREQLLEELPGFYWSNTERLLFNKLWKNPIGVLPEVLQLTPIPYQWVQNKLDEVYPEWRKRMV